MVKPPANEERLIQSDAVASRTRGYLKAVCIAIGVSRDLIDIEVFCIRIIGKVFISGSIEIRISDRSNTIPPICSIECEVRVCCLSCGYMVNTIDDYELIGIVTQE